MYTITQARQDHRQAHQESLDHLRKSATEGSICSCAVGRMCLIGADLLEIADAAGRRWEALEG